MMPGKIGKLAMGRTLISFDDNCWIGLIISKVTK
jgi:hypothetical protein